MRLSTESLLPARCSPGSVSASFIHQALPNQYRPASSIQHKAGDPEALAEPTPWVPDQLRRGWLYPGGHWSEDWPVNHPLRRQTSQHPLAPGTPHPSLYPTILPQSPVPFFSIFLYFTSSGSGCDPLPATQRSAADTLAQPTKSKPLLTRPLGSWNWSSLRRSRLQANHLTTSRPRTIRSTSRHRRIGKSSL